MRLLGFDLHGITKFCAFMDLPIQFFGLPITLLLKIFPLLLFVKSHRKKAAAEENILAKKMSTTV